MVAILKNLLTMSLSGSIIILLVLALRLVLKKAPARLLCLLWLLAGLRLVLPFHIEADFSLQPDAQQLIKPIVASQEYENMSQEYVPQDMIPAMPTVGENITVNTDIGVTAPVQYTVDRMTVAAYVWAVGVAGMLVYTLTSYVRLKRQVREATLTADGAWECSRLNGPFLLGYLKPRIFLPAGLAGEDREYVLSHERTHLAWGDHWTKLLGFLCLSIHWFNPLVWLAYRLLCQDLETACDEQVVKGYDVEGRKAYSKALLACSAGSRPVSACPIAFGEVNVKERIMKVLNYRKPGFWICLVCVIAIIVTAVFFLTDPLKEMTMEDYVALIGTERSELLSSLGLDEEEVEYSETTRLHLLPDRVRHNGREYRVYCSAGEYVHNTAISFKFVSEPDLNEQTSIEAFAQEYLALQAQYIQQFGPSRRDNVYTDVQQIVDAYENRRKTDDGSAWSIDTPWEVYEDIPFANVRDFLKELITWEEALLEAKWYGRDIQGLLRVNLQGNYADGVVVFQINYSAATMPVQSTTIKYDTFFEEYVSALGTPRDEFLKELGIGEDEVSQSTRGDVWLEPLEALGTKWYISNTYSPEQQRVTHVDFQTDTTTNFDDNATHYLKMLAALKQVYGEPTAPGASTLEELRESYDRWTNKAGGTWPETTSWRIEDIGSIHPQLQERLEERAKTEPVTEAMKAIYGSDVKLKPSFGITLICTRGTDGNCRTWVSFFAGLSPDQS